MGREVEARGRPSSRRRASVAGLPALVEAGRRHRGRRRPRSLEVVAQQDLRHRRAALVGGAEQEHVDGRIVGAATRAP